MSLKFGFGTKVSHSNPQNNKKALQFRCICIENGKEGKMRLAEENINYFCVIKNRFHYG